MERSSGLALSLAALAFTLTTLGSSRDARAWCRTTTTQDFVGSDAMPCDDAGKPLFWSSRCVGFSVQRDGSYAQSIDLALARSIALASFSQWANALCPADVDHCTGDTGKHPSISIADVGPVSCNKPEYNQTSGNANVIMFRDSNWDHPDPEVTLALTTVTFSPDTGEIYDADMEINSDPKINQLTTGDDHVVYDLQSIMTHESGHFLGMAHTQPANTTATMYYRYKTGVTFMRHLSPDDMCGICAAYDPNRTTVCDPTPRRGLALSCQGADAPDTKKGCHCGVVGGDDSFLVDRCAMGFGALAFVLGALRRRRRR